MSILEATRSKLNHQEPDAEERARRDRVNRLAQDEEPQRGAMPDKPATGFERFLEKGLALAGARKGGGGDHKTGAVYGSGWAKGLSRSQAIEKARGMYAGLDDSVRQKYEGEANLEDVRSGREDQRYADYKDERAESLGLKAPGPKGSGIDPATGATASNPNAGIQAGTHALQSTRMGHQVVPVPGANQPAPAPQSFTPSNPATSQQPAGPPVNPASPPAQQPSPAPGMAGTGPTPAPGFRPNSKASGIYVDGQKQEQVGSGMDSRWVDGSTPGATQGLQFDSGSAAKAAPAINKFSATGPPTANLDAITGNQGATGGSGAGGSGGFDFEKWASGSFSPEQIGVIKGQARQETRAEAGPAHEPYQEPAPFDSAGFDERYANSPEGQAGAADLAAVKQSQEVGKYRSGLLEEHDKGGTGHMRNIGGLPNIVAEVAEFAGASQGTVDKLTVRGVGGYQKRKDIRGKVSESFKPGFKAPTAAPSSKKGIPAPDTSGRTRTGGDTMGEAWDKSIGGMLVKQAGLGPPGDPNRKAAAAGKVAQSLPRNRRNKEPRRSR